MKQQFKFKPLKERTTTHLEYVVSNYRYYEPNYLKAVKRELYKRKRHER